SAGQILKTAKTIYNIDGHGSSEYEKDHTVRPGQMKVLGILVSEPAGKPLSMCQFGQAIVTLDAGSEDQEVRTRRKFIMLNKEGQQIECPVTDHGISLLRRFKIARITNEASEQGVLLTQEDLAYKIFGCGLRTVQRDIAFFKAQGLYIPTRGQQKDIGKGLTHRVKTIELYIERRFSIYKISLYIIHSLKAVEEYITSFSRIAYLAAKGFHCVEIAFSTRKSEALVREYLALYHKYQQNPQAQERLQEVLAIADNLASISQKKSQEVRH
ncbi:MAG: DUF1670 domain-containing protein, partial [Candidatus Kerfeldbacteria bacterium]|nr:DUF1670 domain-containing protein [Candidatus Kerfeldbacteria bacterium]